MTTRICFCAKILSLCTFSKGYYILKNLESLRPSSNVKFHTESDANGKNLLFLLISIRFGTCKVRRLNRALDRSLFDHRELLILGPIRPTGIMLLPARHDTRRGFPVFGRINSRKINRILSVEQWTEHHWYMLFFAMNHFALGYKWYDQLSSKCCKLNFSRVRSFRQ